MKPQLSIVSTVDSCAQTMQDFLTAVQQYADTSPAQIELLLVNDLGKNINMILPVFSRPLHVRVLVNPQPQGQFAALLQGVAEAQGDAVLTIDPDMAENIADIDQLLAHQRNGCEMVLTWRQRRTDMPVWRRFCSALLNAGSRCLSGLPIKDINSPLRLFSPAAARALLLLHDKPDSFSLHMYEKFSGNLAQIAVEVTRRGQRHSHYSAGMLARRFFMQLLAAWQFRRLRHTQRIPAP